MRNLKFVILSALIVVIIVGFVAYIKGNFDGLQSGNAAVKIAAARLEHKQDTAATITLAHLRQKTSEKNILTMSPYEFEKYCSDENITLVEEKQSQDDYYWGDYDWYPNGLNEKPSDIKIRIHWRKANTGDGYKVLSIMIANLSIDDSVEAAEPVLAFWSLLLPDIVPLFKFLREDGQGIAFESSGYYWYEDTPYVLAIEPNNKRYLKHITDVRGMPDRKIGNFAELIR